MNQKTFSFAAVIGIIVLLFFSYFTFLGMVYWQKGSFSLPITLTIALIAVTILCVFVMCKAKATRWKKIGTAGQAIFGTIILVVFLLSAIPFTNFLRVLDEQDSIRKKVSTTCDTALQLDEEYEKYVDDRIDAYKKQLEVISNGRANRPDEYDKVLKDVAGTTDEQKIENLVKSLKGTLIPDSVNSLKNEHSEWVEKAKKISVWNPMAAQNIGKIEAGVSGWEEDYTKFSETKYAGETIESFNSPVLNNQMKDLVNSYSELKLPSILAILIAVICFAFMLLPYMMTDTSLAGATSKHKNTTNVLYE